MSILCCFKKSSSKMKDSLPDPTGSLTKSAIKADCHSKSKSDGNTEKTAQIH